MPFLYALLSLLLVALGKGLFLVVPRLRRHESIKGFALYKAPLVDLAFGAFFAFLIAIILVFVTGGIGAFNGLVFFATIILLPVLLKPSRLFFKNPTDLEGKIVPNKRKIVFGALLAAGLLFDLLAMNNKSFYNYGTVTDVAPTSFVSKGRADFVEDGLALYADASFTVKAPTSGATSVRFNFIPADNVAITVKVIPINDTTETQTVTATYQMDGKNLDYQIISLPYTYNGKRVTSYRFGFSFADNHYFQGRPSGTPYVTLRSITFNARPRVYFSPVRFLVYAGVVGLFCYAPKMMEALRKRHGLTKKAYLMVAGFGLISLGVAVVAVLINRSQLFTPYPIASEELAKMDTDIFTQLFDALRKGQVRLDIKPDSRLTALANPYDPTARRNSGASYLWDHAFYNGNYYSYYGAVPVILVSFPLYFLTGMSAVPNALCLEIVGMAMLVPAFLLLLLEIYRFVRKEVSWSGYVLLGAAGLITSMMIAAITFKDGYYHESIYHVPDIYGLLFFDLFFFFVLRAYRRKEGRMIELLFSGICVVLMIGSRPNLVIALLISVPFYLAMLIRKEFTWKQKVKQFAPMVGVLAVGAILLCVYNKVRFDSFFEFGQSYQLTVADQRTLTYAPNKLFPSIVHFFFQGGNFYDRFPFISCAVVKLSFDNCPYVQSYFGALLIPMFLGAFFLPALFRKEKVELKAFSWLFPIVIVLFAFTTYSKAGVCPRYLIEPYHLLTIGSFFAILKLAEKTENTTAYQPTMIVVGALVLFSVIECVSLSFDTFDGMNVADANGFLLLWKGIFANFNI